MLPGSPQGHCLVADRRGQGGGHKEVLQGEDRVQQVHVGNTAKAGKRSVEALLPRGALPAQLWTLCRHLEHGATSGAGAEKC